MATWLSQGVWADQANDEKVYARAPNPAEFPENRAISKSYWIREHAFDFEDQCGRAPLPHEVDVVIIGSGITGATVAYQISRTQPNLRVALIDARGLCTGATGRNGGHFFRPEVYQIREFAKQFGAEEAVRLKRFALINRKMMLAAINELDAAADVDLRLDGTIGVFETAEEKEEFVADLEFAKQHGHEPEGYLITEQNDVLSKVKIAENKAQHGAAYIEKSGTIYARKFVGVLLKAALKGMSALTLHGYTPASSVVSDFTAEKYHYTVSTNRGAIRARAVFHATNAYSSHLLPSLIGKNGVYGCKAHMLAAQPNKIAPNLQLTRGLGYRDFYHWILQRPNNGPYLYGLATAEKMGDYNDNITLPENSQYRKDMVRFLETAFPHHFEQIDVARDILYDWTGIQAFTTDGASRVGRPTKGSPGEYASVGHNGEGMGRCFACATVATDGMLNYLQGNKSWTPPEWFPVSFSMNLGSGDF